MRKINIYIFIVFSIPVLTSMGPSSPPWSQENVSFPMMNQEIRHTMQENERQKDSKNKQVLNTSTEVTNRNFWEKFKATTVKVQDRLRFVDFALQAIPAGYVITMETQKITDLQNQLIEELNGSPYLLALVLPSEIQFANDLQMVIRLIAGIVISYGAINQMEKAERKILIDYALDEVKRIKEQAIAILYTVKEAKRALQWRINTIKTLINMDKQIVGDIMDNINF